MFTFTFYKSKCKRFLKCDVCDVDGHVTVCFNVSNMAAEDLPSEFDVVILGTGRDDPASCRNIDPNRVVAAESAGWETSGSVSARRLGLFHVSFALMNNPNVNVKG